MLNRLQTLAVALGLTLSFDGTAGAAPIRILCLGDSITQGGFGLPSYRDPLIRILNGENIHGANPTNTIYSVQFVGSLSVTAGNTPNPVNSSYPQSLALQPNHEGHYGWRADEILSGTNDPFPGSGSGDLATWLQGYTADIVLAHVGTNDALQNHDAPDPQFTTTTWGEISQIIQLLQADMPAPAAICVSKLIPIYPWGGSWEIATQGYIDALNVVIASSVPAAGATLVEFPGFVATTMLADSFHPNATGEAYMASRWFLAMKPTLDELSKPQITSSSESGGTYDVAFSFQIAAENNPTGFGASNLPPGLSVNTTTGAITGTPTAAGTFSSTVSATNSFGTREASLTITIAKADATVSLDDLVAVYNGSTHTPTVATTPTGLTVDVTYNSSATPPVEAGAYNVVAAVDDPNHQGTASDTFVILTPIEGWRFEHFGVTANSGDAADEEDGDGDARVNLVEYAFDLDPLLPDPSPISTEIVDGYLTITVPRNPAALDLVFTAESGENPADLRAEWAEELTPIAPNTFRARDTVLMSDSTRRFIRVRITRSGTD